MQPRIIPSTWNDLYRTAYQIGFRHDRRLKQDIEELRASFPIEPFLVEIPQRGTLVLVKGPLIQDARGPTVVFVVTLTPAFPNSYPIITVEAPPQPHRIKRHPNVDFEGQCYLSTVSQWNPQSSKVIACVMELRQALNNNYPFEVGAPQQLPPPQQPPRQQQVQQRQSGPIIQPRSRDDDDDDTGPSGADVAAAVVMSGVALTTLVARGVASAVLGPVLAPSPQTQTGDQAQRQRQADKEWLARQAQSNRDVVEAENQRALAYARTQFSVMLKGNPKPPGTDVVPPMGLGIPKMRTAPTPDLPPLLLLQAPPPLAPVPDPTPDDQYQHAQEEELARRTAVKSREESQPQPTSTMGRMFKGLAVGARVVGNLASDAKNAVENKVRESTVKQDNQRFAALFPQQAQGETLVVDYRCKTMAGDGTAREGHLFLTERNVFFSTKPPQPGQAGTGSMVAPYQFVVPLAGVVSIIVAKELNTNWMHLVQNNNTFRSFFEFEASMAAKIGHVMSTSLNGTPFDRALNWIDHKWRACGPVPNPSYHYYGWPAPSGAAQQPMQPPAQPLGGPGPYAQPVGAVASSAPTKGGELELCAVCLEKQKDAFFQPCGHVCACMGCAENLQKCPLCRTPIQSRFKAFL